MKKLVLLFSLAFSLSAFAQIEKPITKGNKILSGGGSVQTSQAIKGDYVLNTFSLSLSPGFGYFVIDNMAIGLNTSFGYTNLGPEAYSVGLGPYAKYYFKNGLFLKAELGYNLLHGLGYGYSGNKQKEYSMMPGIGYAFFLNSKVSFEPSVSYKYINGPYTQRSNSAILELKFCIFL